jgi:hypothetical protein
MTGDLYACTGPDSCELAYREEDCYASYEFAERGMVQFLQHYCPNCFAPVTLIDADQIDPSIFDHLGERS